MNIKPNTKNRIKMINRMLKEGITQSDIARAFKISRQRVGQLVHYEEITQRNKDYYYNNIEESRAYNRKYMANYYKNNAKYRAEKKAYNKKYNKLKVAIIKTKTK